jgi:hypothetical protein
MLPKTIQYKKANKELACKIIKENIEILKALA